MFVNSDQSSTIDAKHHETIDKKHFIGLSSKTKFHSNKNSIDRKSLSGNKLDRDMKSSSSFQIPKLVQIQFSQFLNTLLEYASELTYFAINAFQTSSLKRVQINTLLRYSDYCVPRTCAFYYNLDSEFDHFVQKMRLLCATGSLLFFRLLNFHFAIRLAKRTFLDIRMARIHYTNGRMMSLPIIRRSIEIFKCNINRLRDLKQIHQDIGYDLLLPHDQLYLALDLLLTDFELLNCELEAEVKFADAMILQTIIKDIFLQYRIALTWIYPAVKYSAYRPGDPNPQQEIKKCEQISNHPHIEDYCNQEKNTKKVIKKSSSSHFQLLEHATTPIRDKNQNFALDDQSSKSPKKRKYATKIIENINAKDDLTRYLSEKQLHDRGSINIRKYSSNKNISTVFIENMRHSTPNKNS